MKKALLALIVIAGCSSEPAKPESKPEQFLFYSCQPSPDTSPRNLELPALITTECPQYQFKIGLPKDWRVHSQFYPVCLDEKSAHYQRHEVFAVNCMGPHNASGYGWISFLIDCSPKNVSTGLPYESFEAFIKDRCEDHQHELDDPKTEILANGQLSYKFLWKKLIGRQYFNQYTQTVFIEGAKFYYEIQYHAEEPDLQHFLPLYVKVLDSFRPD